MVTEDGIPRGRMTMPTAADVERCHFEQAAHYNLGRKVGYGYGYRCAEHPRLYFIDRTFRPSREHPDGLRTRTWVVDGTEVADLNAALAALERPPTLTEDERRVLALVPSAFEPLRRVEDDLAGVARPDGAIMPSTPHSLALGWLHALRDKGLIEYGRHTDRGDGNAWGEMVPEHMRWSPTVRRTAAGNAMAMEATR